MGEEITLSSSTQFLGLNFRHWMDALKVLPRDRSNNLNRDVSFMVLNAMTATLAVNHEIVREIQSVDKKIHNVLESMIDMTKRGCDFCSYKDEEDINRCVDDLQDLAKLVIRYLRIEEGERVTFSDTFHPRIL